jgi:hypothetical protein
MSAKYFVCFLEITNSTSRIAVIVRNPVSKSTFCLNLTNTALVVDLEDYNAYLEVFCSKASTPCSTITSILNYEKKILLKREIALCHISYDTLHCPNQFFLRFLLNFKD